MQSTRPTSREAAGGGGGARGCSSVVTVGLLFALAASLTLNLMQHIAQHPLGSYGQQASKPAPVVLPVSTSAAVAQQADVAASSARSQLSVVPAVKGVAAAAAAPAGGPWCRPYYLAPPRERAEFAHMAQQRGYKVGVELGVQQGFFAKHMLSIWTSCTKYYLVDIWATQENYKDLANVPQDVQDRFLNDAKGNLAAWPSKTVFLRNFTSVAAKSIPAGLDFVYVDARHDYCGALEDMELYWPKIRPGGMMAGHDYVSNDEVMQATPGQDWSLCMDGTRNDGAVRGAVNDFALRVAQPVLATTHDGPWRSWVIMKPVCQGDEQQQ